MPFVASILLVVWLTMFVCVWTLMSEMKHGGCARGEKVFFSPKKEIMSKQGSEKGKKKKRIRKDETDDNI